LFNNFNNSIIIIFNNKKKNVIKPRLVLLHLTDLCSFVIGHYKALHVSTSLEKYHYFPHKQSQ
jgi:hypothetical protein